MVTKVGVCIKNYILHVSYMYWSIKFQDYILRLWDWILILKPNMT